MRRTRLLVAAIFVALIPVHVGPAKAADRHWVGPFEGTRYVDGSGGSTPDHNELHATIHLGAYQNNVVAVATYQCDGDFIRAVLDCTRMPPTGLDRNVSQYPQTLHSDSLALADLALYRARLTDGHVLRCYGVDGPSVSLPEDQSASWNVAGTCTVL